MPGTRAPGFQSLCTPLLPPLPAPLPCSPAVLVGGSFRGALRRGALRGPFPLGVFAQPLEHGGAGGCRLCWAPAWAGGRAGGQACDLIGALQGCGLVGRQLGGQFLGGPSLQVRPLARAPQVSGATSLGGRSQPIGWVPAPPNSGRFGLAPLIRPGALDHTQAGNSQGPGGGRAAPLHFKWEDRGGRRVGDWLELRFRSHQRLQPEMPTACPGTGVPPPAQRHSLRSGISSVLPQPTTRWAPTYSRLAQRALPSWSLGAQPSQQWGIPCPGYLAPDSETWTPETH